MPDSADLLVTGSGFTRKEGEEFAQKAMMKSLRAKRLVMNSMLVCGIAWLAMFVWAMVNYWGVEEGDQITPASTFPLAQTEVLSVQWPSPLFRPKLLACAGDHVFTSDGYRIFKHFLDGTPSTEVPCPGLDHIIADLSAACNSTGCHAVALVHDVSSGSAAATTKVVDCGGVFGGQPTLAFAQETKPAEHLAVISGSSPLQISQSKPKLLATHMGELVQYTWVQSTQVWIAEWGFGSMPFLSSDNSGQSGSDGTFGPRALSSSGGAVMIFRSAPAHTTAVEVRSTETMQAKGEWRIPAEFAPLKRGCAKSSTSALILADGHSQGGDSSPLLILATLA